MQAESLKQLRRETELLIPFKRGEWILFSILFLTQHIFQRRLQRDSYKKEGKKGGWEKTLAKSFQTAVDLWRVTHTLTRSWRRPHTLCWHFRVFPILFPSLVQAYRHTNNLRCSLSVDQKHRQHDCLALIAIALWRYIRKCRDGILKMIVSGDEIASRPPLTWLDNIPPLSRIFCSRYRYMDMSKMIYFEIW